MLIDEGIGGSMTLRGFRAPGRRHGLRRSWFTGSVVLTRETFAAFSLLRPVIFVRLTDVRVRALECRVTKGPTLCGAFDASAFRADWSGRVECRFKTPKARAVAEALDVVQDGFADGRPHAR